jgi:hypothetical protein
MPLSLEIAWAIVAVIFLYFYITDKVRRHRARRRADRRPGVLQRSPNGSVLAPWRPMSRVVVRAYDRRNDPRRTR